MKKYAVTFIQYWEYEVCADDERMAYDKAYPVFISEMLSPVAYTSYDDYTIEEIEE